MSNSTRTPLLIAGGGLLIGLAVGLIVLFGLPTPGEVSITAPRGPGTPEVIGASPYTGAVAPDFKLQDLGGNTITLADAKGHPLLINFWATWCVPCRIEMPAIESRYQSLKSKGLLVYAIDDAESKDVVQAYVESLDLTFTILLDPDSAVNDLYQIRGYPTSFFIDGDGQIWVIHIGAMTEAQLDDNLSKIMP